MLLGLSMRKRRYPQPPASGLQTSLQPTPGLQKDAGLQRLWSALKHCDFIIRQHPPRDPQPFRHRATLLHINPDSSSGMESEKNQIPRMADIELRPSRTKGFSMGSHLERHRARLCLQKITKQKFQRGTCDEKALPVIFQAIGIMTLTFRFREAQTELLKQHRRDAIATVNAEQKRFFLMQRLSISKKA